MDLGGLREFWKKHTKILLEFIAYKLQDFFIRTFNDKAYTSPQLFGQFFNFRIIIKFFIYEVKKTSKF